MNAKKIILTTLLLLALIIGATVAVSADSVQFGFASTASGTMAVGDTFDVTITMSGAPAVKSISLSPVYDPNKLEFVEGNWSVNVRLNSFMNAGGEGAVAAFVNNTDINGELFTMKFRVKAPGADTTIGIETIVKAMEGSQEVDKVGSTGNPYNSIVNGGSGVTVAICNHDYTTSAWDKDASGHFKLCSVCGEQKGEQGTHTYDDACDDTCVCGETRTAPHSYATAWSKDANGHWHECSLCHDKKDEAGHVYTNGCDETCDTCLYTRTVSHDVGNTWEKNDDEHWKVCGTCTQNVLKAPHQYTDACDKDCNDCGHVRVAPHSYATTWSRDDDKHWHECSLCHDKKDEGTHSYTDVCDKDCNTCGHERTAPHSYKTTLDKNDDKHWYECSLCHDKKDETAHGYADACDTTCDDCGHTRTAPHAYATEWSKDTDNHWYECSLCHTKKDLNAHNYSSGCDETCDTCGATRTAVHDFKAEWSGDLNKHWHECKNCDAKRDESAHSYDDACDADCNVCGKERTPLHQFESADWDYDNTKHFAECPGCGTPVSAPHTFTDACDTDCNDGCGYTRVTTHHYATYKNDRGHWESCSVCGHSTALKAHTLVDNKCACGYVYVEHVHTLVLVPEVKATCEENGTKEHYQCEECTRIYKDENGDEELEEADLVIAATGHTEVTDEAVEATCETDGKTEGSHCSACDQVFVEQETIPATGHTEETIAAVEATCESTGLSEGVRCTVCQKVLTPQTETPALDHVYTAWQVTQEPTETTDGEQTRYCLTCGKTEKESVPATDNTPSGDVPGDMPGTAPEKQDNTALVVVGIVTAVVVVAGAAVGVVWFVRKNRF